MNRNAIRLWVCITILVVVAVIVPPLFAAIETTDRPNILFILAGYGDVGVFFQNARRAAAKHGEPWHATPQLDKMAAEGLQLTGHYCPAPVCAPSRASLLLGIHQGHSNVRDNQFDKALENNHTFASVLRQAGYTTAAFGKWGLQGKASANTPNRWPGHPMNRGFDYYFGYISHNAGHAHYPKEDGKALYDKAEEVSNKYDGCYTTDLFTARAKKWITDQVRQNPQKPFFAYLAYDTPHAKLQYPPCPFPSGGGLRGGVQWQGKAGHMINTAIGKPDSYCHPDYKKTDWPDVYKRYASDVRRIDDCIGDILQLLKDLRIDRNTLVVFTTDNGPSRESYIKQPYKPTFFHSFGPFDGIKRDVWEGGIRVGAIVRWPKAVPGGRTTNEPCGFWDWMPTFAAAAGVPAPARTDGVSLMPTLTDRETQKPSRIYIEYLHNGSTPGYDQFNPAHRNRKRKQMQAIRIGDYIGVRYNIKKQSDPFEIYNIVKDPSESRNLAGQSRYTDLQKQMHRTVLQVRRPNGSAPRPYDNELVPAIMSTPTTVGGVQWRSYNMTLPYVPKLDDLKPNATGNQSRPNVAKLAHNKNVAILFTGYLQAPADGQYAITLTTGSKAMLKIHDATIIDADFNYKSGQTIRQTIRLKAGKHPFRLYYIHGKAEPTSVQLKWSGPGFDEQAIPATAFIRDAS